MVVKEVLPGDSVHSLLSILDVITVSTPHSLPAIRAQASLACLQGLFFRGIPNLIKLTMKISHHSFILLNCVTVSLEQLSRTLFGYIQTDCTRRPSLYIGSYESFGGTH